MTRVEPAAGPASPRRVGAAEVFPIGFGRNETELGGILAPFRSRVHLASKCGVTGVDGKRVIDGRPTTLRLTLDDALVRLRMDVIDLCYLHRVDKAVPVEESIGEMARMVAAGKIRAIGLSEVSAATLRRAHAVHPVTALQSECSLWSRNAEIAVLDECRRLGIAFVAFSPLARGFLPARFDDPSTLEPNDLRRGMPRFQPPNWVGNATLQARFRALAAEAGCSRRTAVCVRRSRRRAAGREARARSRMPGRPRCRSMPRWAGRSV
jgi:aryl-alcohol dehydrogenase-like predicted oxidoreductase